MNRKGLTKHTLGRRWVVVGCTLGVLAVLLCWGWVTPDISVEGCSLAQNAAWISVDWTSQLVDAVAVEQLAEEAKARQFRYLFPFTTYVRSDGAFSPSYEHSEEFVSQFRACNQETRLLAWVGIPLQNEGGLGIEGWVDLSKSEVRQEIISFVIDLLDSAGFDGVHLNIETVIDGDPDYLRLLEETRLAIGPSRMLSIAGNDWKPTLMSVVPIVGNYKWSGAYYRSIAERVDQIATMTYDSLAPHPALYRLWMRQQVRGISRGLENSDTELLIGVSISRERSLTHHPKAENLLNGLAGICAATGNPAKLGHGPEGVAIYAAWEADATDWQTWETWLASSTGAEH